MPSQRYWSVPVPDWRSDVPMLSREVYIRRLARMVACGSDDPAATDEEYGEAVAFLGQIRIAVPVDEMAATASATA